MSSQKAMTHIKSEMYGYRTPVFVLNAKDGKSTVNIRSCAFNTSFYNISLNNNTIRWLRKVNTSVNNNVLTYYPDSTGVVNPYIGSNSKPLEEWHLCELRIPPGAYTTTDSIIEAINKTFSESVKNLLNIKTTMHQATENAALSYDNLPENDDIMLKDSNITNVQIIADDDIGYISDKSFIYDYKNENEEIIRQNSPYRVVNLHKITGASFQNAALTHPAFANNQYTYYKEENDFKIKDTALIPTTTTDNLLNEFSILSTDGVIVDVNGLKSQSVDITKGIFKSFPCFIGLDSDDHKGIFSDTSYNYVRSLHENMQILMDANVIFNNITDKNQYSYVKSGVIKLYDDTYTATEHKWNVQSPISYTADILTGENDAEYRFYYDDNSLDDNNKFYFINIDNTTDANGCVADDYIPDLTVRTHSANKLVQVVHGEDINNQGVEIEGFDLKQLQQPMNLTVVPTNNLEATRSSTYNMKALNLQSYATLKAVNSDTINILKYDYYACDGNGNTQNIYNESGIPNNNDLYYSDGELEMKYYKCDLSKFNIVAISSNSITIQEAQAIYYESDSEKQKYTIVADGIYDESVTSLVIYAHKVIVANGIIDSIIVKQSDAILHDDDSIDVYYKYVNARYETEFTNTANDNDFDLVSTTITNQTAQDTFTTACIPYNIAEQPVNGIYNAGINNAYYVGYGTNTTINDIRLSQKLNNAEGLSTAGKIVASQKIFADCVDKNITYDVDITKFKPVRYGYNPTPQNVEVYNKITAESYDSSNGVYVFNDETNNYSLLQSIYLDSGDYSNNIYASNIADFVLKATFDDTTPNGDYVEYEDEFYKISGNKYHKTESYDPDANGSYINLIQFTKDAPNSYTVSTKYGRYILETTGDNGLINYFTDVVNSSNQLPAGVYVETDKDQYDKRHDILQYNGDDIDGKLVPKIDVANASLADRTDRSNYQEIDLDTNTYYKSKAYELTQTVPSYEFFDVNTKQSVFGTGGATDALIEKCYLDKIFYAENKSTNEKFNLMIINSDGCKVFPSAFPSISNIKFIYNSSDNTYTNDGAGYSIYKVNGSAIERMNAPELTVILKDVYVYAEYPYIVVPQTMFETYYFNNHYYYITYPTGKYADESGLDGVVITKQQNSANYLDSDNVQYHVTCIDGNVYPEKILLSRLNTIVHARDVNYYTRSIEYAQSTTATHDFKKLFKYFAENNVFEEYNRDVTYYNTFKLALNNVSPNAIITRNNVTVDAATGKINITTNEQNTYNYTENTTNSVINLAASTVTINGNVLNYNIDTSKLSTVNYNLKKDVGIEYTLDRINDSYYAYVPIEGRYQEHYKKFNYGTVDDNFNTADKYYRTGVNNDEVTQTPQIYKLDFSNQGTVGVNSCLRPQPLVIDLTYASNHNMLYKVENGSYIRVDVNSIQFDSNDKAYVYIKLGGQDDAYNIGEQYVKYQLTKNDTLITINDSNSTPIFESSVSGYKYELKNSTADSINEAKLATYHYVDPRNVDPEDKQLKTQAQLDSLAAFYGAHNVKATTVDATNNKYYDTTTLDENFQARIYQRTVNSVQTTYCVWPHVATIFTNLKTSADDEDHTDTHVSLGGYDVYAYNPFTDATALTVQPFIYQKLSEYIQTTKESFKYYYAFDGFLFVDFTKLMITDLTNNDDRLVNKYYAKCVEDGDSYKYELHYKIGFFDTVIGTTTADVALGYPPNYEIPIEEYAYPIVFKSNYTGVPFNYGITLQCYMPDPNGYEYLIDGYNKSILLSTVDSQQQYYTYEALQKPYDETTTHYIRFENNFYNLCTSPFYARAIARIDGYTPTVSCFRIQLFTHDFMYCNKSDDTNIQMIPLTNTVLNSNSAIEGIGLFNMLTHEVTTAANLTNGTIYAKTDNYAILIAETYEDLIGFTGATHAYNLKTPYICINNNFAVAYTENDQVYTTVAPAERPMTGPYEMMKLTGELAQAQLLQSITTLTPADNETIASMITRATLYDNDPILMKPNFATLMNTVSNASPSSAVIYRKALNQQAYHKESEEWYMKRVVYTPSNTSTSTSGLYVKLSPTINLDTPTTTAELPLTDPVFERLNTPSNYPDGYVLVEAGMPPDNSIYIPLTDVRYAKYVDRFMLSSDFPQYITINGMYNPITSIYKESDYYIYVQTDSGTTVKITYNSHSGYITTSNINNLLADILAKNDKFESDENNGTYIKINELYLELASFTNRYTGYMNYEPKTDSDIGVILYAKALLANNSVIYVKQFDYYQISTHAITTYTYADDTKRYILPLEVAGTSSRTNISYKFGLNCLFNTKIAAVSNNSVQPSPNTKIRLIGLSVNNKVIFKADVNSDLYINFNGVSVKVNEIVTVEKLQSYYPDSIIDNTFLQNLVKTDLTDATIEYNNELVDCNMIYKTSNLTYSDGTVDTFDNVDNRLFTEQIVINTSPTNGENYGVVAYSKSYKCHANEFKTPLSETVNGITYTIESAESDLTRNDTNTRSYIYKPFAGDHDTDSMKNTEWIDASILHDTNTAESAFKNNSYKYISNAQNTYSAKSSNVENKIYKILNAFEYNPHNNQEDKYVQKSLSVLALGESARTKRIVKRPTFNSTPSKLNDEVPVEDTFYIKIDRTLSAINNGTAIGHLDEGNAKMDQIPFTVAYEKPETALAYIPFYNAESIHNLSITPISSSNKYAVTFKVDETIYAYDNCTIYYYNLDDNSATMVLNPTLSASLTHIQCIIQVNGTHYAYNTKYIVFNKSTTFVNQDERLSFVEFKTSQQIITQNDTIASVCGHQSNNQGDILNIYTTVTMSIDKEYNDRVMCLGYDSHGLLAPISMNEGTFLTPQDLAQNGTNVVQIGIETEKDPNSTSYFSPVDTTTLFYDRDLKIAYKYGHYLPSGENIYAPASDNKYVYRISTSQGVANIPLENRTVMYVYASVTNPYNYNNIAYFDTNTYKSIDNCVLMPIYKQAYKSVSATNTVTSAAKGYKHRYMRYFKGNADSNSDPIGVFVEDVNGTYIRTNENMFYNLNNMVASEEFTFICNSKDAQQLNEVIQPSLTADYRKMIYTASGEQIILKPSSKYAFIKGRDPDADVDVNEVVVFDVDENTKRYTYIPLKQVPCTAVNGKYYDKNTCKFYDEGFIYTPQAYDTESDSNYFVNSNNDIYYVQICDAVVNYNELSIEETETANLYKLTAHRIITNQNILRCGNFVYIDSAFSSNVMDNTCIGYYDYYAMLAHPTAFEYITSFYAQTIESSNRGDMYLCTDGMYVIGENNFYEVIKVDDVKATDSSLFNYLKGDVVINTESKYKTYRVKLVGNGNTSDTPAYTSLTFRDIITGEETTVTEGDYTVVAIMEGTTIKLDDVLLGLAQYIHKSILPKAMDNIYLYSSRSTINTNTVYQSPITQTIAIGMTQCIENNDYMFRFANLTPLDLDSFVHYHIYHEDLKAANDVSTARLKLNHITSMNATTKTFYRKYTSPLANTIKLIAFKDSTKMNYTYIDNNIVPESIFSTVNTVDITTSEHYVKNISVTDKNVVSTMLITDDDNNEVGVFLNLGSEYDYTDYYYNTSIDLVPKDGIAIYSKGNVDGYVFDKNILRKGNYNIPEKTYYNLSKHYAYSGPTAFTVNSNSTAIEFERSASVSVQPTGNKIYYSYSLYDSKGDTMNVHTNINVSAIAYNSSNNIANTLKIPSKSLTQITDFTHNTAIYPQGDLEIDFNTHNFRIRANSQPNVYDVNIYNDGSSTSRCTFMMDGNRFVVKSFVNGVMTDVPYTSSKLRLLNINTGTVTEGTLTAYHPTNISRYMDLSSIRETSVKTNEIQSNKQLIYDEYYNKILTDNFEKLFTKQSVDGNTFTKISTDFPCIFVSSDIIYSKQSDFRSITKSNDFDEDYDTQLMPTITVFDKSKYGTSSNIGLLNKYNEIDGSVDDFYYNFTVDEDVLYKLGYLCPKISNDDKHFLSINGKRAYVIKGKYYSECVYNGPLTLQNPEKIYNTVLHGGKSIKKYISLPAGYNILDLDTTLIDKFFNKSIFASQRLANLSIPTCIQVKLTQSNDVEKLLNSADNYSTNALPIGEFPINTRTELPYANIAQCIDINYSFDLPKKGSMYLYLTSPNQRYPIINNDSMLTVEFI